MPRPTDTHYLRRSLELIAESIAGIERQAESSLRQIDESGVGEIVTPLADAAIHAGMPAGRAANYSSEYDAILHKAKQRLAGLVEQSAKARSEIETLVHIATVVPHRCPNPGTAAGRPALVLTN
jgi:hypothetical protein